MPPKQSRYSRVRGQKRDVRGAAWQLRAGWHNGRGALFEVLTQPSQLRQRHRSGATESCDGQEDGGGELHLRSPVLRERSPARLASHMGNKACRTSIVPLVHLRRWWL